jgi:hypothetical protein
MLKSRSLRFGVSAVLLLVVTCGGISRRLIYALESASQHCVLANSCESASQLIVPSSNPAGIEIREKVDVDDLDVCLAFDAVPGACDASLSHSPASTLPSNSGFLSLHAASVRLQV